jgi:hypothetical protein
MVTAVNSYQDNNDASFLMSETAYVPPKTTTTTTTTTTTPRTIRTTRRPLATTPKTG